MDERGKSPSTSKPTSTMPPGMVMGPDGKPCKICTAFRNWRPHEPTKETNGGTMRERRSTAAIMAALAGTPSEPSRRANCPPDVEQLGSATWAFLHTTAAYYPDRPTPNQRANMLGLLHSLPLLYPCSHCASHLADDMKDHPPDVSGKAGLSQWLCERHNVINERLGKSIFDCAKTDERWKDGPSDGTCD